MNSPTHPTPTTPRWSHHSCPYLISSMWIITNASNNNNNHRHHGNNQFPNLPSHIPTPHIIIHHNVKWINTPCIITDLSTISTTHPMLYGRAGSIETTLGQNYYLLLPTTLTLQSKTNISPPPDTFCDIIAFWGDAGLWIMRSILDLWVKENVSKYMGPTNPHTPYPRSAQSLPSYKPPRTAPPHIPWWLFGQCGP